MKSGLVKILADNDAREEFFSVVNAKREMEDRLVAAIEAAIYDLSEIAYNPKIEEVIKNLEKAVEE